MLRSVLLFLGLSVWLASVAFAESNPFVGRWDFAKTNPNEVGANWLGITAEGEKLDIWFQPLGGHVIQVPDYSLNGSHLVLNISQPSNDHPGLVWDLEAQSNKLTGTEKHGTKTRTLSAVHAPDLKRPAPASWSKPEPLFDGKDLAGWKPLGDPSKSHWIAQNGELVNAEHGANLVSTRKFADYKLHFEVNCPDDANSGFYQRGRYELQLEYERQGSEPPERGMGAIYGRIAPSVQLPRRPGEWETFDVTLVGRNITVSRDGTMTIDNREIEGITGGALDANEGQPGPFYIQGDHTGGLKFRNITIAVPAH